MSKQELLAEISKLPSEEQQQLLQELTHKAGSDTWGNGAPMPEAEFERMLLEKGIIIDIPADVDAEEEEDDFEPIGVVGKPVSETIIEERR